MESAKSSSAEVMGGSATCEVAEDSSSLQDSQWGAVPQAEFGKSGHQHGRSGAGSSHTLTVTACTPAGG